MHDAVLEIVRMLAAPSISAALGLWLGYRLGHGEAWGQMREVACRLRWNRQRKESEARRFASLAISQRREQKELDAMAASFVARLTLVLEDERKASLARAAVAQTGAEPSIPIMAARTMTRLKSVVSCGWKPNAKVDFKAGPAGRKRTA